MTVVVLGIDALDPDLVDPDEHPNLTLDCHRSIDTICSETGEPSTHELWPTIITGLEPDEHGLTLADDGVAWDSVILNVGSSAADRLLPASIQTRLGAWLLNNTSHDAFRTPASYYRSNHLTTVFDDTESKTIGIPNYVVDPDDEDREHQLRQQMGTLFERDVNAQTGHTSSDPETFYEHCLEMAIVRIGRVRRALRSRQYELIFGYTSALDLVGHVAYDRPSLQHRAYDEFDDFVGELRADLSADDVLVLVSDHGLQDGVHTDNAMIASTAERILESVENVRDVRESLESELDWRNHRPSMQPFDRVRSGDGDAEVVHQQLEDLGYL